MFGVLKVLQSTVKRVFIGFIRSSNLQKEEIFFHFYSIIRPFQYDPEFKPILVETPNFPGYPAGHTTVAGSIATVLSFLFPQDKQLFLDLAKECSESRFEGGVHFRTDNEVGLEVGYKVGQQVIQGFTE